MAITYFGSASNPSDNGSLEVTNSVAVAVTPPAGMQAGDLVILHAHVGMHYSEGDIVLVNSGGQNWNQGPYRFSGTVQATRIFWCVFNGTWSSNPSVSHNKTQTLCMTVVMHVFRSPSSFGLVLDNEELTTSTTTPVSSPFDVQVPSVTTHQDGSLVYASWALDDNQTWALQTAGWTNAGNAQYRNIKNIGYSDLSISAAYKIVESAGASGIVTNRTTVGQMGIIRSSIVFLDGAVPEDNTAESSASTDAVDYEFVGEDPPAPDLRIKALLHCEGANGSQVFVDSSPYANSISVVGASRIDTTRYKFNATSGFLDGNSDYILIPWLVPADSDFTLEVWIYSLDASLRAFCNTRANSGSHRGFQMNIGYGTISVHASSTGAPDVQFETSSNLNQSQWAHIAFIKQDKVLKVYINGILRGSGTLAYNLLYNPTSLYFGSTGAYGANEWFYGNFDEVQLLSYAKWTTNFTPPTAPYVVGEPEALLGTVTETPIASDIVTYGAVEYPFALEPNTSLDTVVCSRDSDICDVTETFSGDDTTADYIDNQTIDLIEASETSDILVAVAGLDIDISEASVGNDTVAGNTGEPVSVTEVGISSDAVIAGQQSDYQEVLSETMFMYETTTIGWSVPVSDGLVVTDTAAYRLAVIIHDWLTAIDAITPNWTGTETATETITVLDIVAAIKVYNEIITDSVDAADMPTITLGLLVSEYLRILEAVSGTGTFPKDVTESLVLTDEILFPAIELSILDALGFSDVVNTVLSIISLSAAETLTVNDATSIGWINVLTDAIAAVDTASVAGLFLEVLSESLVSIDTASPFVSISESLTESLEISEIAVSNGTFGVVVHDAIQMAITVELDGEIYECYVLNTGKFLPSVYSGFGFNSYATFEGRAFAANSTGIFEITGDTDNGAVIHTGVILPETKFGTTNHKRMRKAYLGISGTRPVIQMEIEDGTKEIFEIDADGEVDGTHAMKSKAWKLTVADFETLDFIKLFPVVLAK